MNKKLVKVLTLILSCLLLISAAVGITVAAEEAEDTVSVKIDKRNIYYDSKVQIMYRVDSANVGENTVKMLFSDKEIAVSAGVDVDELAGVKVANVAGESNGKAVFLSDGILPTNYRVAVYAVAVVVDAEGKVVAYDAADAFSPYDYGMVRFDGTKTDAQFNLYKAMLDYGAAVQDALGIDVNTVGGWIDAYYNYSVDVNGDGEITADENLSGKRAKELGNVVLVADRLNKNFVGFFDGETQVFEYGKDKTSDTWYKYTVRPGNHNYSVKYDDAAVKYDGMNYTEKPGFTSGTFVADPTDQTQYITMKDGVLVCVQDNAPGESLGVTHHAASNYTSSIAYEFDMKIDKATSLRDMFIYLKYYATKSGAKDVPYTGASIPFRDADADGSDNANNNVFKIKDTVVEYDQWFNIRLEFVKVEGEYGFRVYEYVNGQSLTYDVKDAKGNVIGNVNYQIIDAHSVPYIHFETRWVAASAKSNVIYSIDNYRVDKVDDCAEHVYGDVEGKFFLVSNATCQSGSVYYKSCVYCGYKGTETFVADDKFDDHTYSEATCTVLPTCTFCGAVDPEGALLPHSFEKVPYAYAVKTPATATVPAVYYESCSVCHNVNEEVTFSLGKAESYYGGTQKAPAGMTLGGNFIDPSESIGYYIASEGAADALNYFVRYKDNDMSTKMTDFSATKVGGVSTYYYQFDFRLSDVSNIRDGNHPTTLKLLGTTTAGANKEVHGSAFDIFVAEGDTHYAITNGVNKSAPDNAKLGEWVTLTFKLVAKDISAEYTKYDVTLYINGVKICTTTTNTASKDVPKLRFEPRYSDGSKYKNAQLMDFDNVLCYAEHTCNENAQIATEGYLAVAGNCEAKSVYYKSCSICGKASENTFEGDYIHGNFVEVVDDKYVATVADCTNVATYYVSCELCGAAGSETFEAGTTADHVYLHKVSADNLATAATSTAPATYYVVCKGCGDKKGTFAADDVLYDMENGKPAYLTASDNAQLVTAVPTESDKVYYGVFGEAGNKYFISGKYGSSGTGQVNFALDSNAYITKQIITFDFLNVGGGVNSDGNHPGWVKLYDAAGTRKDAYTHSFGADYITIYNQKIPNDTWVSVRIELDYTTEGKTCVDVYYTIDGVTTHPVTGRNISARVVKLQYELRWNWTTIAHQIDNVHITNEHICEECSTEVVTPSALKAAATATTPAVYYKTCQLCGTVTDDTFTFGNVETLFVGSAPAAEKVTFANGVASAPATDADENGVADGAYFITKTETYTNVKGEEVENTYVAFVDDNYTGQRKLSFKADAVDGKTKYVFSFNFRWQYAKNVRHNAKNEKLDYGVFYNNSLGGAKDYEVFYCSTDGSYVTIHGTNLMSDEWAVMEYVFTWNETNQNYDIVININGKQVHTRTGTEISMDLATRWGAAGLDVNEFGTGNVDMAYDLDDLYFYAE